MAENHEKKRTPNLQNINPFQCRMWHGHSRMLDFVSEESCRDEIASFRRDGQKQPVLGRRISDPSDPHKVELIYGARRLFVAQHLNVELLCDVQVLTDEQAFVEMDIENRLRCRLSAYEQGMAYKEWLREGYFDSQQEIARALGISNARVSRLMKFAELPAAAIRAFRSPTEIKEAWAVKLAEQCEDPETREAMLRVSRAIAAPAGAELAPLKTFKLLIDCNSRKRRARLNQNDTVVRSEYGRPLFRISYRNTDVHIIVRRDLATDSTLDALTNVLQDLLRRAAIGNRSATKQSVPQAIGKLPAESKSNGRAALSPGSAKQTTTKASAYRRVAGTQEAASST